MSQPIGIPTAWHGTFDVVFESQTRVHIPDAVRARLRRADFCGLAGFNGDVSALAGVD